MGSKSFEETSNPQPFIVTANENPLLLAPLKKFICFDVTVGRYLNN